jgi:uncharacterized protein YlzI (FlbEa/FlbD family)
MDEIIHQLRHSIDDAIAKEILSAKPVVLPMTMTGTLQFIPHNKIEGMRVIFNDPTTILIVNGKKYISKAHDEEFDEEKGLLMCLAKASGYTHANLKALLKGAQRQTKKQ